MSIDVITLPGDETSATVEAVRAFNRFYTHQLGLVGRAFLDSRYSLTEARILYELDTRATPTAKQIAEALQLDAAYLSRTLKAFRKAGLLDSRADPADQRSQRLEITGKGRAEAAELAQRSRRQVAARIETLEPLQRQVLAAAMAEISSLLSPRSIEALPLVLRPHQPGDIGWIVHRQMKLYADGYGWNAEYEGLAARIAGDFLIDFKPGREACWIAEQAGQVAGSVFLVEAGPDTAKLRLLYVEPACQGRGIGKALVRRCIASARDFGYQRMTLWTNDVLAAARRLYEAEGFRLISQETHHSFGKDLNGQTWQLDFDGASMSKQTPAG